MGEERKLIAAAVVLVNPLVYWQQIFGANDILVVALLLLSLAVARTGKTVAAAAVLGVACATKQLAWPFAPFLLAHLAGVGGWRDMVAAPRRWLVPLAVVAGAFLVVVLPVAALDFRAFWGDIVVYNVGLPGGDNYPLGGTPGFGFANFLIYFAKVAVAARPRLVHALLPAAGPDRPPARAGAVPRRTRPVPRSSAARRRCCCRCTSRGSCIRTT